ncbi:MAG: DUF58 domain-containing protein [Salinivirgaceae bacterium]|nr:DUF58 domain-containing protein [Salinivirgaceae bacterium]
MKTLQEIFALEEFDNLEWVSKQVVEGFITGMHKSPYHGFSVEFAEHRLYNSGESTKHIDWKLYARTDKLFIKRYEEETNLRCMLLLDTSSSMLFPFDEAKENKLSYSVYSAAALIYLLRKQRDAVGLTLFSNTIEFKSQIKLSESHGKMLYAELNRCLNRDKEHFNKTTNIAETLHLIAENVHKRSLIVLFTDMFSTSTTDLFSAIEHLKYNKHEVIIFHVTDSEKEHLLDYPNRPTKFVDLETGEVIKLNPNDIRKDYKKNLKAQLSEIKLKCAQYKIELINADISFDFREVLIPFLVKRKTMR